MAQLGLLCARPKGHLHDPDLVRCAEPALSSCFAALHCLPPSWFSVKEEKYIFGRVVVFDSV